MRAHLFQMDIAWEDKSANFAKVERLLDAADVVQGDLIVLPEMFDTGFSMNVDRTADRDGQTLRFLIRLAEDLGVYIIGGRTVQACEASLAHNRCTVISPAGDLLADYSKIHPFTFGHEAERFEGGHDVALFTWSPGHTADAHVVQRPGAILTAAAGGRSPRPGAGPDQDEGPRDDSTDDESIRICPTICYDLRFPELFRIGLLRDAELFTVIANWPEARQSHWRALMIARAIENQAFVLGINRSGSDPHLSYAGGTIAVGPQGEILGELGREEGVLSVRIKPRTVHAWREKFPAWRDLKLVALGE